MKNRPRGYNLAVLASTMLITLYRFRAQWFWKSLFFASALFLLFPPLHTVLGLVSLVLLLRFKDGFDDAEIDSSSKMEPTPAFPRS